MITISMIRSFCIIVVTLITACIGLGQIEPIKNSVKESWVDKVPVSGEIRTGILLQNDFCESLKSSFSVRLPQNNTYNLLGVEISSNDGRYNYRSVYNITKESGWVNLKREAGEALEKKLKSYKCNELTILAWIKNDFDRDKENFVVAHWGNAFDKKFAYIHLLSENPAFIYITYSDGNAPVKYDCKQIDKLANVAYNCECAVPLEKITASSQISVVQRVRRSQNRYPLNIKL